MHIADFPNGNVFVIDRQMEDGGNQAEVKTCCYEGGGRGRRLWMRPHIVDVDGAMGVCSNVWRKWSVTTDIAVDGFCTCHYLGKRHHRVVSHP